MIHVLHTPCLSLLLNFLLVLFFIQRKYWQQVFTCSRRQNENKCGYKKTPIKLIQPVVCGHVGTVPTFATLSERGYWYPRSEF